MPSASGQTDLNGVIEAFRAQLAARGAADDARLLETHISKVLLAGTRAWKFKKAVDLGFLDFTTLARRRHFCAREVALNARYAPGLYEGVEAVRVPADGPVVEYAVRMRRFDPAETLDRLVARGAVAAREIADFARDLAEAHARMPVAADPACGSAALCAQQILASAGPPLAALLPAGFTALLERTVAALQPLFSTRRAEGRVRECHGDLHLGNVVRMGGRLLPFDCLEFDHTLSTIDTASDWAFLLLDLDSHGARALGHVFFNRYLEASGDHACLPVLRGYLAYRALVRAKVSLLGPPGPTVRARAESLAALAAHCLAPTGTPGLVITHGVSGSGKSHHARQCAERWGFLHLRSDVERKRLAGLAPDAASASAPGAGLYTPAHTERTYQRLVEAANHALAGGFSAIVDATFLERARRAAFASLAVRHGAKFHVLECAAPLATLRARIAARLASGRDPSEATLEVLERQQATDQPLDAGEQATALTPARLFDGARADRHPPPCGRRRTD